MFPTVTIPKLHLEYRNWLSELVFCKEEITRFERSLERVVNKRGDVAVKAEVEHFQNQFIRQKEVMDELRHQLHLSERQLAGLVKELSGLGLESIKLDNHLMLRNDVNTFRKIYAALKEDFRRFEIQNR